MLSSDKLRALEAHLGVEFSAKWNRIEASHDSLRKAELWPTWDVFEALSPEFDHRVTDGVKSRWRICPANGTTVAVASR